MKMELTKNQPSTLSAILDYRVHFFIYAVLIAFCIAAYIYPLVAGWEHYWQIVRIPKLLMLPMVGFVFFNCCWKAYITSYELQFKGTNLFVKRPWGRIRTYQLADIISLSVVSRRTMLLRTKQRGWIPISGINADGLRRKQEIEKVLREQLSRLS